MRHAPHPRRGLRRARRASEGPIGFPPLARRATMNHERPDGQPVEPRDRLQPFRKEDCERLIDMENGPVTIPVSDAEQPRFLGRLPRRPR